MFDIGFSELLVIAIVALVVLGPERLPKAARFAGLWVRRARNQWDSVKQELERELQAEDIKRQMQDVRQSMQDTESELRASGEAARRQMQDVNDQG
ncbi:MAG: twin-arginine translocase subunit TatB, partial [Stenotrophomonas sp.]|nr:twin-arginine translocase subunit TatB [Stenotrophomonas sp.]